MENKQATATVPTSRSVMLLWAAFGLTARSIFGAMVGFALIAAVIGVDYLLQSDKRYYFMDREASIITMLILFPSLGAAVGFLVGAFSCCSGEVDRE
jgi:hypothetical protein